MLMNFEGISLKIPENTRLSQICRELQNIARNLAVWIIHVFNLLVLSIPQPLQTGWRDGSTERRSRRSARPRPRRLRASSRGAGPRRRQSAAKWLTPDGGSWNIYAVHFLKCVFQLVSVNFLKKCNNLFQNYETFVSRFDSFPICISTRVAKTIGNRM